MARLQDGQVLRGFRNFCCRRNAHLNRHGARTSTWRIRRALPAASQKRAQCENKRADCYSLLGAQSTPPATRFGMQIHTSSRYLGFYDTRAPGYSPAGSGVKLDRRSVVKGKSEDLVGG